jgi:hypothetical protein
LHFEHCLAFLFGGGRSAVDFRFSASINDVCSEAKNDKCEEIITTGETQLLIAFIM